MPHDELYWLAFPKSSVGSSTYKSLFENAKGDNWDGVFSALKENKRVVNAFEIDLKYNNSLLHYAAFIGVDLVVVERLIEFGALRNLRNNLDQKPLDIAKQLSHTHLFSILEPINLTSVPLDELMLIEQNFHDVILQRENGDIGDLIQENYLPLPQLEPLLELDKPEGWFPIPGYMGGFGYWLRVNDNPIRLICNSGSRMDQVGQQQLHEITSTGSKLLEPDDANNRFMLSLKLRLR